MTRIIDRRNNKNKSAVNRQRFLRRYKDQIQQAVNNIVGERSITKVDKGEKIILPNKNTTEPYFTHGQGGVIERVFTGNKEFIAGDTIKRSPVGGKDEGSNASNTGEGNDDFVFELSREEFLDIYFDQLELPNLIKKELAMTPSYKYVRGGITSTGTPTNINIIRSMRQATGRRMAIAAPYKRQLVELEQLLDALGTELEDDSEDLQTLRESIAGLERKIAAVPYIDKIDLRYNYRIKQKVPSTQAVMLCLMDVSGSMDQEKKEMAKRFFILLYLFLTRNYEKIELVFIRHHTSAKEVEEEEFFYSRETGGTVVSTALEMALNILRARYPTSAWNAYIAQASDGDNWNADSPYCQELLLKLLPLTQYFSYVEINPRHHQSLWEVYQNISATHDNFAMQTIYKINEIYPVFHELFKKKALS